jgi:hypothetical protein
VVIIWTHDEGTNQNKDASKVNDNSEELNEYVNSVSKKTESNSNNVDDLSKLTKNCHNDRIIDNSDSSKIGSVKELQNNLQVVDADVHNENLGLVGGSCNNSNKIDVNIDIEDSTNNCGDNCNGGFKNRASHFSYKKQAKRKVSMLIHRHTL